MTVFDETIDRRGTDSVKWDLLEPRFGGADLVPMWVADMDFRAPHPVIEALEKRAAHGIFGYTKRSDALFEAVQNWFKTRHGWPIERDWIEFSPGVVAGITFLMHALTEPGDKIIIQPPVYHPFAKVIERGQRTLVENRLLYEGGRYRMDFDDLREKAKAGASMLILCSPHNPVGRVWKEDELRTLGEICLEHGILVVSDEIHSDLLFRGVQHTPFGRLGSAFAEHSVVLAAPSKTFNLAGLKASLVIIPNEHIRKTYQAFCERMAVGSTSLFGMVAMQAAYAHGGPWLDELLAYLQGNLEELTGFFQREVAPIRVVPPEGTYLVWLDCRALGMNDEDLSQFMREKARVALNDGSMFGPGGEGFERINIGCPRPMMREGLSRIAAAVREIT